MKEGENYRRGRLIRDDGKRLWALSLSLYDDAADEMMFVDLCRVDVAQPNTKQFRSSERSATKIASVLRPETVCDEHVQNVLVAV